MVPQKSSLRNCLILIHAIHLRNCLQLWMLIDPPLEMVQKTGNWVPHELKENEIEERWSRARCCFNYNKERAGDEKLIHYDNPKCSICEAK
ncbi:hypothetical protein Trydic_g5736 [Trypoxylus dichotomus]